MSIEDTPAASDVRCQELVHEEQVQVQVVHELAPVGALEALPQGQVEVRPGRCLLVDLGKHGAEKLALAAALRSKIRDTSQPPLENTR